MKKHGRGQAAVVVGLIIPVLIGAIALGTDIGLLYYNSLQVQKAIDAGVLAGASYLPDNPDLAVSTANRLAQANGVKAAEIVSTAVAADHLSINMQAQRAVPYSFATVLGLANGTVSVTAAAAAQYPPSTVNAPTSSQIPPGGDNNGNNGITCASTGACGLVPIGSMPERPMSMANRSRLIKVR